MAGPDVMARMTPRTLLLAGLLAWPLAASAAVPCPDLPASPSLANLVERALCASPDTRAAWQRTRTQQAQVGIAEAGYYPTLNATAARTRNLVDPPAGSLIAREQTRLALTADWLLWDFGGRRAGLDSARQTLAALQATLDARSRLVAQQALQAAFDQLSGEAALFAADEAVRAAEETVKATRQRLQVGSATREDELQALTALANARLTRVQRSGDLAAARGRLALAVGYPAGTPLSPSLPLPATLPAPPPLEQLQADAVRQRPELAAQQQLIAAASNDLDRIAAQAMPRLSLGLTEGETRDALFGTRTTRQVGVTATLPLFTGFQQRNQEAAARSQIDQQGIELDRLRLQVSQEVWQAWHLLATAQARSEAADTLLAAASETLRAARARYQAGLGNLLNVLNAQNSLAEARQQQASARHAWAAARLQLAQASGLLLQDPEALLRATSAESVTP